MYNVFEIKSWLFYFENGFALKSSLFGDIKLSKNPDPDKYFSSGYVISLDIHGTFSLPHGGLDKNVVIFGADMSSSMRWLWKNILFLVQGSMEMSDDTALTAEVEYSINFTKDGNKFKLT